MTSDWKAELDDMFQNDEKQKKNDIAERALEEKKVVEYIETVLVPACDELKAYFEDKGKRVSSTKGTSSVTISVSNNNGMLELSVQYKASARLGKISVYPENTFLDKKDGKRYTTHGGTVEGKTDSGVPTKDDVIANFVREYKQTYTYPS
ncbi:MAG: hypothetical protein K8S20_00535 [Chloroflexi bacterium]|nr:hypothetical protein [Chloroflexota bacterium]